MGSGNAKVLFTLKVIGSSEAWLLAGMGECWIGKYPVTNQQFQLFVKKSGLLKKWSFEKGKEQHPAVNVNWQDGLDFCRWVSIHSKQKIRLPTEAEWEKAARRDGSA